MTQQQLPPTNVEHPITNQQVVMIRQTASGFEQGIAASVGLITAGPLGALASWGTIRGLQGKWFPWFVLGVPMAPILALVQLVMLGGIVGTFAPDDYDYKPPTTDRTEQIYLN